MLSRSVPARSLTYPLKYIPFLWNDLCVIYQPDDNDNFANFYERDVCLASIVSLGGHPLIHLTRVLYTDKDAFQNGAFKDFSARAGVDLGTVDILLLVAHLF